MRNWTGQPAPMDYRTMPRRVLTFAIGGKAVLPPTPPPVAAVAHTDPDFRPDPARAARGGALFSACAICHGMDAVAAGSAPDLRWSAVPTTAAGFAAVVHDGALLDHGMPVFDQLTPEQLEDIRFYLRSRARESAAPAA